jgi:hypothetical protein
MAEITYTISDEAKQVIGELRNEQKAKTATVSKIEKQLLESLEEAGGKLTAEDDIVFEGNKIILPASMTVTDGIRYLENKLKSDEKEMSFSRDYNYRPWDGAYATANAFKKAFGTYLQKETKTMFGEMPPQLVTIATGPNSHEEVPWGEIVLPFLPGVTFTLGSQKKESGVVFVIYANGPRKERFKIQGVFNLIEKELAENSLYRGKAFNGAQMPEFLDLSKVSADKVIYSEEVLTQFDANVWSLIKHTDEMTQHGVPLKRAVLLEGPYGTGKTLGAFLTAKIAEENDWTFIYCRPGKDNIAEAMHTAKLYEPAIVFFEDVDTISSENTNTEISSVLDTFDGVASKGSKIVAVLTTNHLDKIHKGMLRPGRLDSIIHIGHLDEAGVRKMVASVIPADLLEENMDWDAIAKSMEGYLPAFISEAAGRAIRYNVARNGGKATKLTTADFIAAADGLRPQWESMQEASETARKTTFEDSFKELLGKQKIVGSSNEDAYYDIAITE